MIHVLWIVSSLGPGGWAFSGGFSIKHEIRVLAYNSCFMSASAYSQRVAFVGVGRMGASMARRLHDVGITVSAIYDVNTPIAQELAKELGADAPSLLTDVAVSADVIITVVTDDAAMYTIYVAEGDSLMRHAAAKTFINCATVTPEVHLQIGERVAAAGGATIAACMAGSITQARDGTLYLICGGEQSIYEKVRPLLEAMGASRYVGSAERAAQVKALVNMLMNINTAALAEALGLGAYLGIDLDQLRDIFAHTGANSRVLVTDGPDMQARDHEVYFAAAHAAKDSGIAVMLARERGLSLPLAEATKSRYDELVRLGFAESDKSAIAELTFPGRVGAGAR